MSHLFTPLKIKEVEFRNRIFVSPMCQYSSVDGMPTDWHLVHLVSRAVGGAGLVMVEATAVSRQGRISPDDSGIWADEHIRGFQRITRLVKEHDAAPGIQLAHAGRKASTRKPWLGGGPLAENEHPWQTLAPSAFPFAEGYPAPKEINENDLDELLQQYETATKRALEAGFETVEIHMAHGYLLHQFLSPLSNKRTDKYGGSFENRTRFPLEVARVVRDNWPEHLPLFVRISVTDWADGGWDLEQSIQLAKSLKEIGIDLIDCSSGGLKPGVKIPAALVGTEQSRRAPSLLPPALQGMGKADAPHHEGSAHDLESRQHGRALHHRLRRPQQRQTPGLTLISKDAPSRQVPYGL